MTSAPSQNRSQLCLTVLQNLIWTVSQLHQLLGLLKLHCMCRLACAVHHLLIITVSCHFSPYCVKSKVFLSKPDPAHCIYPSLKNCLMSLYLKNNVISSPWFLYSLALQILLYLSVFLMGDQKWSTRDTPLGRKWLCTCISHHRQFSYQYSFSTFPLLYLRAASPTPNTLCYIL